MPRLLGESQIESVKRVVNWILGRQRTIQVTIRVTPLRDTDTLQEVSDLVRNILAESCGDEHSDTFKDVKLLNACEEYFTKPGAQE